MARRIGGLSVRLGSLPSMANPDAQLWATMTEGAINRVEAWRAGDQRKVAAVDTTLPKDQRALAALWAAGFGMIMEALRVLDEKSPGAGNALIQRWRDELPTIRQAP